MLKDLKEEMKDQVRQSLLIITSIIIDTLILLVFFVSFEAFRFVVKSFGYQSVLFDSFYDQFVKPILFLTLFTITLYRVLLGAKRIFNSTTDEKVYSLNGVDAIGKENK